jgi:hypothetical protein
MGIIRFGDYHHDLIAEIETAIHHPGQLSAMIREAEHSLDETGLLPHDRVWDYLTWRRDLDVRRFDRHHPEFVKLFHREEANLERLSQVSPSGLITGSSSLSSDLIPAQPPVQVVQPPPPGTPIHAGSVPEPSSILIFGLGIAAAFVASELRRRRPGP